VTVVTSNQHTATKFTAVFSADTKSSTDLSNIFERGGIKDKFLVHAMKACEGVEV